MTPATLYHLPDWPAIREACARGEYQRAYGAAGLCPGKDGPGLAAWRAAAEYIEECKARHVAAQVAAWRARHADLLAAVGAAGEKKEPQ